MWLRLTCYSSCILSAVYGAVVFAAAYVAVLPAADTADIIAYMCIAHIALVHAFLNVAGRIAHNSACVGGVS